MLSNLSRRARLLVTCAGLQSIARLCWLAGAYTGRVFWERLVKAVPRSSRKVTNYYFEGTGKAAVKMSWSLAILALLALAVQIAGGDVLGHRNRSGSRVSIHNG